MSVQPTLWDSEQRAQLQRVAHGIGATVLDFLRQRWQVGGRFHAADLRNYVAAKHPVAPASADRILRDLRSRGVVQYEIVSRAQSLYRVTRI